MPAQQPPRPHHHHPSSSSSSSHTKQQHQLSAESSKLANTAPVAIPSRKSSLTHLPARTYTFQSRPSSSASTSAAGRHIRRDTATTIDVPRELVEERESSEFTDERERSREGDKEYRSTITVTSTSPIPPLIIALPGQGDRNQVYLPSQAHGQSAISLTPTHPNNLASSVSSSSALLHTPLLNPPPPPTISPSPSPQAPTPFKRLLKQRTSKPSLRESISRPTLLAPSEQIQLGIDNPGKVGSMVVVSDRIRAAASERDDGEEGDVEGASGVARSGSLRKKTGKPGSPTKDGGRGTPPVTGSTRHKNHARSSSGSSMPPTPPAKERSSHEARVASPPPISGNGRTTTHRDGPRDPIHPFGAQSNPTQSRPRSSSKSATTQGSQVKSHSRYGDVDAGGGNARPKTSDGTIAVPKDTVKSSGRPQTGDRKSSVSRSAGNSVVKELTKIDGLTNGGNQTSNASPQKAKPPLAPAFPPNNGLRQSYIAVSGSLFPPLRPNGPETAGVQELGMRASRERLEREKSQKELVPGKNLNLAAGTGTVKSVSTREEMGDEVPEMTTGFVKNRGTRSGSAGSGTTTSTAVKREKGLEVPATEAAVASKLSTNSSTHLSPPSSPRSGHPFASSIPIPPIPPSEPAGRTHKYSGVDSVPGDVSLSDWEHYSKGRERLWSGATGAAAKPGTVKGKWDEGRTLTSLYLVSGLTKDPKSWSLADSDSIRGVQPLEDSLGCFWRPEVLGRTFGGETPQPLSRSRTPKNGGTESEAASTRSLPQDGKDSRAMGKMVAKALKLSHPREVEIVNASLAPPSVTHCFTFNLSTEPTGTVRGIIPPDGRSYASPYATNGANEHGARPPIPSSMRPDNPYGTNRTTNSSPTDEGSTWYGVCLTVWNHADKERAEGLRVLKYKLAKVAADKGKSPYDHSNMSLYGGMSNTSLLGQERGKKVSAAPSSKRGVMPWRAISNASGYISNSETEGAISDSDIEGWGKGGFRRRQFMKSGLRDSSVMSEVTEDNGLFEEGEDLFWIPYALTLVSKYPIYDCMADYLKLSWARFSKNVKAHSLQISRILHYPSPRPGETVQLITGLPGDEDLELCCDMPGSLDFQKGLVQVNFQLWPLFKALSIDNVLTCVEVALSTSGRVVFVSKYPSMLGSAVSTLKYIVELRGWSGIALPLLHARDMSILIEDPGPYIIGINNECRNVITLPADILAVDIDNNHLSSVAIPDGVISLRAAREKFRKRLLASLGPTYTVDFNVPAELKLTFPSGRMRPSCVVNVGYKRPAFLGDVIRPPSWWNATSVIAAFDRILVDKHKKPTLLQRITNSGGMSKRQAALTIGEIAARQLLRQRALHYIETRDELELKVGRINRRLLHLIQEGEMWRKRFEQFEQYADRLGKEASDLKIKIESERKESKRLSGVLNEQSQQNSELLNKLLKTEEAREEAMRNLADMHESMQELEREREIMIGAIEYQLESVIMRGFDPPDDQSETSTQRGDAEGKRDSVRSGRDRASTIASRTTTGTQLAGQGVLDAATGRRASKRFSTQRSIASRDPLQALDNSITYKSDKMAERMSAIQKKLDLALQAVSDSKRDSVILEGDAPDGEPATMDDVPRIVAKQGSENGADGTESEDESPTPVPERARNDKNKQERSSADLIPSSSSKTLVDDATTEHRAAKVDHRNATIVPKESSQAAMIVHDEGDYSGSSGDGDHSNDRKTQSRVSLVAKGALSADATFHRDEDSATVRTESPATVIELGTSSAL